MIKWSVLEGDCLGVMAGMEPASIDSIVTDPPYGLGFKGKSWDHAVPGPEFFAAMLRVAKPGAHLVAFGGTRLYHRMACAIEDAGWEVRDCLSWLYGSGFPKSHNGPWGGTALKPAWEPVVLARKPLDGTVAANHLRHGVGGLNIEQCRVEGAFKSGWSDSGSRASENRSMSGSNTERDPKPDNPNGRWPANLILDAEAGAMLDAQTGVLKSGTMKEGQVRKATNGILPFKGCTVENNSGGDSGGASRFFYCPKANKGERDEGMEEFEAVVRANGNKWTDQDYRVARGERPPSAESGPRKNHHPTVKPTDLMRWLVRLVTPERALVLDPFTGSGSTGRACVLEGRRFVGIEREPEYCTIARARIAASCKSVGLYGRVSP